MKRGGGRDASTERPRRHAAEQPLTRVLLLCVLPSLPPLLQGYVRVPRYNDAAVKEALYSRGPLAMSFDASRPSFTFYSSGVYAETEV